MRAYEDSPDPIFELHRGGKIHVVNSVGLDSKHRLSSAYTPEEPGAVLGPKHRWARGAGLVEKP